MLNLLALVVFSAAVTVPMMVVTLRKPVAKRLTCLTFGQRYSQRTSPSRNPT